MAKIFHPYNISVENLVKYIKENRDNVLWGTLIVLAIVVGGVWYWNNTNKTKNEKGQIRYIQAVFTGMQNENMLLSVLRDSKGTVWADMAASDLAGNYYMKGDLKKSLEYLEGVSKKNPFMKAFYYSYMYAIYYDRKDRKKALDMLKKASNISEFKTLKDFFKLKLAERLIESGKYKEAYDILTSLSRDPFSPYKDKAKSLLKVVHAFVRR